MTWSCQGSSSSTSSFPTSAPPPPLCLRTNKIGKRLQDLFAQEFNIFKPDKILKWLPHLGTVRLELQLDDRTVEADVPPLEAAFIEMFSNKGEFAFLLRKNVGGALVGVHWSERPVLSAWLMGLFNSLPFVMYPSCTMLTIVSFGR